MHSDLANLTEAAELLRLKPSTIRAWVLRRKIPFVKLGRRVLFRHSDLEALITGNVVPARAENPTETKQKPMVNTNADNTPQFLPQS